jgi:hypothetical protein
VFKLGCMPPAVYGRMGRALTPAKVLAPAARLIGRSGHSGSAQHPRSGLLWQGRPIIEQIKTAQPIGLKRRAAFEMSECECAPAEGKGGWRNGFGAPEALLGGKGRESC